MRFISWIGAQLAQGIVQAVLVVIVTAIAPVWAFVSAAPGYQIFLATLVSLAVSLVIVEKIRALIKAIGRTATLHLQVFNDNRYPALIREENMFRWYVLRNIFVVHKPDGNLENHETVTLFISFLNDVRIGTLEVKSDSPMPLYETKEYNQRFAIVHFAAALPIGTLEIKVGA
jgi:hypothetical protein